VEETGGQEWCSEEGECKEEKCEEGECKEEKCEEGELRKRNVRKGSVVDDQLGVVVALFLLSCWIAGCQVLLSRRSSCRLKLLG
jgi:hypothetical protein